MKTNDAVGIDIGDHRTKVTRLHQDESGEVEIIFQGSFPSPGQDNVLFDGRGDELSPVAPHTSRANVTIGVSGQRCLCRFTKVPPVAPKRVPDIAAYEADQQIPFDMNEVEWFYHHIPNMPDTEIGIFAMKKELLAQPLEWCEKGGFEAVHFAQPTPIAIYNAMTYLDLWGTESTLVLDIGHESTNLIIRGDNSTFWVRTIPLGAMAFVEAMAKGFKLSESKALILLKSIDESKYKRQFLQCFRPVFADFVQEVQRSVGFFSSTHSSRDPVRSVAFLGQTSLIPGLRQYIATNIGVEELELSSDHAEYLVSYGLALQGLGLTEISGDFMPKKSWGTKATSALQRLRIPKILQGITMIEVGVVFSIAIVFFSMLFGGKPANPDHEMVPALQGIKEQTITRALETSAGREALAKELVHAASPKEPYVIIRILTESDGVQIDPQFYPPLEDSGNPLSHRIGKAVLEELGVADSIPGRENAYFPDE